LVVEVAYDHMQGSRFRHTAQFDPNGEGWWNLYTNALFGEEIGDECSFLAFTPSGVYFDPAQVKLGDHWPPRLPSKLTSIDGTRLSRYHRLECAHRSPCCSSRPAPGRHFLRCPTTGAER
jgi:hypothetical protein